MGATLTLPPDGQDGGILAPAEGGQRNTGIQRSRERALKSPAIASSAYAMQPITLSLLER